MQGRVGGAGHATAGAIQASEFVEKTSRQPGLAEGSPLIELEYRNGQGAQAKCQPPCPLLLHL